jgi:large-conductance mechanosensitive channel
MLIDIILTPIIQRFTGNKTTKLEEVKISILGVNLQIGLFLSKLINFIIILIIVYYIWKLSTLPNFNIIKKGLDSVKPAKPTKKKGC